MQTEILIEKLKNHQPDLMEYPKRSAVLMPFVETEEGISLLFETRGRGISDPGEVCFPGGRMEKGETPQQTAVRETCEELGVCPEDIEIFGENDRIAAYGGRLLYSFAGALKTTDFHISKVEVHDVFTIPLQWLLTHQPEDHSIPLYPQEPEGFDAAVFGASNPYPWRRGVYELPLWKYEGHYLWGFSARMVQSLLRILTGDGM